MTITDARAYAIDEVDLRAMADEDLRRLAELEVALVRERIPEDPAPPVDVLMRRMKAYPDFIVPRNWVATTADGGVVARANLVGWTTPDNQHLRECGVWVRADHRRRGLARELIARVVAAAPERPDLFLQCWTNDRVPSGEPFAKRVGGKPGLSNRMSQLDLAAIDRPLVAQWARLDPPGYRLVWIGDEAVPEGLMSNVVDAYKTMNDAPREGLNEEDWIVTPELVRDFERASKASGMERRLLLAIHEATGQTAGFTETGYQPRIAHVVSQHGTAVVPSHRGHGIGKWIKARMVERTLAERPAAKYVRTGNAYSNAAMLSINDRLGFKVIWSTIVWQLPIVDAKRYVEGRTA